MFPPKWAPLALRPCSSQWPDIKLAAAFVSTTTWSHSQTFKSSDLSSQTTLTMNTLYECPHYPLSQTHTCPMSNQHATKLQPSSIDWTPLSLLLWLPPKWSRWCFFFFLFFVVLFVWGPFLLNPPKMKKKLEVRNLPLEKHHFSLIVISFPPCYGSERKKSTKRSGIIS